MNETGSSRRYVVALYDPVFVATETLACRCAAKTGSSTGVLYAVYPPFLIIWIYVSALGILSSDLYLKPPSPLLFTETMLSWSEAFLVTCFKRNLLLDSEAYLPVSESGGSLVPVYV